MSADRTRRRPSSYQRRSAGSAAATVLVGGVGLGGLEGLQCLLAVGIGQQEKGVEPVADDLDAPQLDQTGRERDRLLEDAVDRRVHRFLKLRVVADRVSRNGRRNLGDERMGGRGDGCAAEERARSSTILPSAAWRIFGSSSTIPMSGRAPNVSWTPRGAVTADRISSARGCNLCGHRSVEKRVTDPYPAALVIAVNDPVGCCSPDPTPLTVGGLPGARLRRVIEYVNLNLHRNVPLAELSAVAYMSPYHFARLFRQSTGESPHRFTLRRRIDRAKLLLADGAGSIEVVAAVVGFRSANHFTTTFRRIVGVTPSAYRAGAATERASR